MSKFEPPRDPGAAPAREEGVARDRLTRRSLLTHGFAFFLSLAGGRLHAQQEGLEERTHTGAPRWDEAFEVAISFQIGDPRSAAAKRPYVAVFIEDASGRPVRTIVLWALRQDAWIRQLRSWYRGETSRKASEGGSLIATLSSPTRPPGKYTVLWDGKNNAGELVEQGTYFVLIETIRQNAGNHLVRQEFTFGDTPFEQSMEPFASISDVEVSYRRRS